MAPSPALLTQAFNTKPWVILSPIERSIKRKIEAIGTPLKDWSISINYGIKTGFNDAFIINGAKKDELISADPKSAEIIRPILRGRDIKRYRYDFADLWLINTHNGIKEKGIKPVNVEDYPVIKKHLDFYYPQLEKRADKGDTPYNLRNCAYMEDFYKQKIVYPTVMRLPRNESLHDEFPSFSYDFDGLFIDVGGYIMVGEEIDLVFLYLSSDVGFYTFSKFHNRFQLDTTGFLYTKESLKETLVPLFDESTSCKLRDAGKKLPSNMENIERIIEEFCGFDESEKEQIRKYKKNLLSSEK